MLNCWIFRLFLIFHNYENSCRIIFVHPPQNKVLEAELLKSACNFKFFNMYCCNSAFLKSSWLGANGSWSHLERMQIHVIYTLELCPREKEVCIYRLLFPHWSKSVNFLAHPVVHAWGQGIRNCHASLSARRVFLGIQSCRVWEALGQRVRKKYSWGELLSGYTYTELVTAAWLA